MTVYLSGRRNGTTHRSVTLLAALPDELRLIGGMAVTCRVGTPHRATVDLYALARGLADFHEVISRLAVTAPGGGQYGFDGSFDLDVIDVSPSSARELLDELRSFGQPLTDLDVNMVGHVWAHDTAEPLDIVALEEGTGTVLDRADHRLVASVAGLVVMKATTVPLRSANRPEKRASDLYDLGRLLLVPGSTATDLGTLPDELAGVVHGRIHAWFVDGAGRDRTYREVRRFDEPRLDLDSVSDAAEALTGAWSGPG